MIFQNKLKHSRKIKKLRMKIQRIIMMMINRYLLQEDFKVKKTHRLGLSIRKDKQRNLNRRKKLTARL